MPGAPSRNIHFFMFGIVLFALSQYFGYEKIINLPPQSHHMWRQFDCLALTLNYYEGGMKFFEPRVYNDLTSNGYCAGEFPFVYYTVASAWKLTGVQYGIYRSVQLLIFYAGLFSLFALVWRSSKNVFYAYLVPVLLFTCPFIMLYAIGYLPDVPSLSFSFIGINMLHKYSEEGKNKWLFPAGIALALAVMIKANAMILVIALFIMFVLAKWVFSFRDGPGKESLKLPLLYTFLAVFTSFFAWYLWAVM